MASMLEIYQTALAEHKAEEAKNRAFRAMLDNAKDAKAPPIEPGGMQRTYWTEDGGLHLENIKPEDVARIGKFEPAPGAAGSSKSFIRFRPFAEDFFGRDRINIYGESDITAAREAGGAKVHMERMAAIREAAFLEERARILAALQAIAPMEQPYTRKEWAWEQRGARDHHAKVLKAIQEPKKDSNE